MTELRTRPASTVFLHVVTLAATLIVFENPVVAQWNNLKLKAQRFVEELSEDALMIPPGAEAVDVGSAVWDV